MSKSFYVIFLSVASAKEVGVLFGLHNQFIGIIYFLLLLYIIFIYFLGNIPDWVWIEGLNIVGVVSLVSLGLILISGYTILGQKIESCICLYAWIGSLQYLVDWGNKNNNENI